MASGQLSIYGAQQFLGICFGQAPTAPPTNYYLALLGITPDSSTLSMSSTDIQPYEPPAASNYARLVIPNNSSYWTSTAASNQAYVSNSQTHSWPVGATTGATSDWPVCYGWALCDVPSGTSGNVWAVGTLAVPVAVPNGFCAYLGAGTLWIELSPFFQITTGG